MPEFLLIETATSVCSVAIANENNIVAIRENADGREHAALVTVFADEVMKEANWKFSDLDAVVVSSGPGSYTGLRIGVSAAKGICFAANIPLIAVDTLEALAAGFVQHQKPVNSKPEIRNCICSVLDARRDEVYYGIWNVKGEMIVSSRAAILNDEFLSIINSIGTAIVFVGNGAEKVKMFLADEKHEYHSGFSSSAKFLQSIAIKKFKEKDFVDVAYFEPNYIKPFYFAESKKV